MKTVQTIIDLLGGLARLRTHPIKIDVEGFMPLSIEFIGTGPRGLPLISVVHVYEQHGDIIRDPEMEFEIDEEGIWHPISYRQDSLGMMQEAIFYDSRSGDVKIRLYLLRDLKQFSKTWSRNLDEQGFADKARELGGGKPPRE